MRSKVVQYTDFRVDISMNIIAHCFECQQATEANTIYVSVFKIKKRER